MFVFRILKFFFLSVYIHIGIVCVCDLIFVYKLGNYLHMQVISKTDYMMTMCMEMDLVGIYSNNI